MVLDHFHTFISPLRLHYNLEIVAIIPILTGDEAQAQGGK